MEYGYEISDTAGNKSFFVEGCTYCSMSTGGLHEVKCPLYQKPSRKETYTEFGARLKVEIDRHPEWRARLI